MAHVALVNNLSAEPFRLIKPIFATRLSEFPPSDLWQAARNRRVDLALITVARQADVSDVMEPIGQFGVACNGAVGSVLCLSNKALPDVARNGQPVYLTRDSETSVLLFQQLWSDEFGAPPNTTPHVSDAVARVCIGNKARTLQLSGAWPFVRDLGEWWHARTGLPFVFARWMIRKSCSQEDKNRAHEWLADSVSYARSNEGLRKMIGRTLEQRLFDERAAAAAYFSSLISRFSPAETQAEALFLQKIADSRLCGIQSSRSSRHPCC